MKLPLILIISSLLSPVYAQGVYYGTLSNEQLEAKCDDKDGRACFQLAKMIEKTSTQENQKKSNKFMEKGCDAGYAQACEKLGERYRTGSHGLEKSMDKALEYYNKLCDMGHGFMCFAIGASYWEGKELPQSTETAIDYFRRGCELNNPLACAAIQEIRDKELRKKEQEQREEQRKQQLAQWETQCNKNDAEACFHLGNNFNSYKGDYQKANTLLAKSCELGYGEGCYKLAENYKQGNGVQKSDFEGNAKKSNELMEKACNVGYAKACRTIAARYDSPKTYSKANEFDKKGCDLGNFDCCVNLAESYEKGAGVPKSLDKAKEILRETCDKGSDQACNQYRNILNQEKREAEEKIRQQEREEARKVRQKQREEAARLREEKRMEYFRKICEDSGDKLSCRKYEQIKKELGQ